MDNETHNEKEETSANAETTPEKIETSNATETPEAGPMATSPEVPTNNTTDNNSNNFTENNTMKDKEEKTEEKTDKKEVKKETNKTGDSTAVVKKDYTALIAAAVALVLLVGLFVWQNYRKRKEDENTHDLGDAKLWAEGQKQHNPQENLFN